VLNNRELFCEHFHNFCLNFNVLLALLSTNCTCNLYHSAENTGFGWQLLVIAVLASINDVLEAMVNVVIVIVAIFLLVAVPI
jgi:hypothetical protein